MMLAFVGTPAQPLFGGIPDATLLFDQSGPVVVLVAFLAISYALLWLANELANGPRSPKQPHRPGTTSR